MRNIATIRSIFLYNCRAEIGIFYIRCKKYRIYLWIYTMVRLCNLKFIFKVRYRTQSSDDNGCINFSIKSTKRPSKEATVTFGISFVISFNILTRSSKENNEFFALLFKTPTTSSSTIFEARSIMST